MSTPDTTVVDVQTIVEGATSFARSLTGVDPGQARVYHSLLGDALEATMLGQNLSAPVDTPVVVVEFRGEFTANGMPRPADAKEPPKGRQLLIVVRDDTGDMTDYGLVGDPIDLAASLGDGSVVAPAGAQ